MSSSEFILVGVGDADATLDHIQWAAAEAARRHCELRLVHAFTLPASAGYPDFTSDSADLRTGLQHESERALRSLALDLQHGHPDLQVTTTVRYQRPVDAIRSGSVDAALTVVGSGDQSRLPGVVLGSVALAVASSCPAPVAVIHSGRSSTTDGPVVLGVDGPSTSEAAVAFAFHAASIRGAELLAVHVWHDMIVPGSRHLQNPLLDPTRIEQEERAVLAERVAGWADKYPDVPVRQVLVRGRATTELLEYAKQAQLLVVGTHGHGGFAGMLLGSTTQALIVHSAAPVVVVRPPTAH